MTKTAAVAAIVGVLIPFVISILKQAKLPRWANMLITIIVCAGAGLLTVYAVGDLSFTPSNILVTIGLVFVASQAVYASYWRESPVEPIINEATSF